MTPRENYTRSYEEGAQGAVVDGDWGDRDATVRTKTMGRGEGSAGASMTSTSTTTIAAGARTTTATDGTGLNRNGNGKGKGEGENGDAESGADVERGENVGRGGEGSSDPLVDGGGGSKSGGSGGVDETMTREVAFSRPPATPQHQRTNERGIPSSVTPRDESREYELESLGEHSREASSYVWRVLVPPQRSLLSTFPSSHSSCKLPETPRALT